MFEPVLSGYRAFDLLLAFFATVIMPLLSALAGARLAKRAASPLIPRYWQTILRGAIVAGLVVLFWHWSGRPFADLGLGSELGFRGRAGFFFVAIAAIIFARQLVRLRSIPVERLEKAMKGFANVKIAPGTRSELAVFILVAISAGIWEEMLYRGFLIWFLKASLGIAGAIAISSFVFGAGHTYQGPKGVAITTLAGFAFAVSYVLTQSLWWLMAVHALIDIYSGSLAYRMKRLAKAANPS